MDANPKLLDRAAAVASGRCLDAALAAGESMVDYGTHLLVRVMHYDGEGTVRHVVPVCILAKQVVAMLDAATVLLRSGCAPAAFPIYRSLYEADLQMAWILAKDSEERARTYWVAHLLRELRRCRAELVGNASRTTVSAAFPLMRWREDSEVQAQIAEIEAALNRPENSQIRPEVEQRVMQFWATRLGCGGFEQVARELDRWAEYEVMYRMLSANTHVQHPGAHVRIGGGKIEVRSLRDSDSAAQMFSVAAYWALRSYSTVLTHYRREELPNFGKHYVEKWRPALRGLPASI